MRTEITTSGPVIESVMGRSKPPPSFRVRMYRIDGTSLEVPRIDANHAVGNFPNEWSFEPWPKHENAR